VPTLIGLLRAINVGGTGRLPMADLRSLCEETGFSDVRTYIQSGNLVFSSRLGQVRAKAKLEKALAIRLSKPCKVLIRTPEELEEIVSANPFPEAAPDQLIVFFLDDSPPEDTLEDVKITGKERLALHGREIFIHFPGGIGRSKLAVPFASEGTGRNLNTIGKLIALARAQG